MTETADLLTTAEAAALIGVAKGSLNVDRSKRHWGVPFVKLGPRLVRYRRKDVLAWIEAACSVPTGKGKK